MTKWKRILIGLLLVPVFAYLIQVLVVVSWRVFPVARAEHDGKLYTVQRGYGDGSDFVPLLGLLPVIGEPVLLIVEDISTGQQQEYGYDLADDVYDEYPEVFAATHEE